MSSNQNNGCLAVLIYLFLLVSLVFGTNDIGRIISITPEAPPIVATAAAETTALFKYEAGLDEPTGATVLRILEARAATLQTNGLIRITRPVRFFPQASSFEVYFTNVSPDVDVNTIIRTLGQTGFLELVDFSDLDVPLPDGELILTTARSEQYGVTEGETLNGKPFVTVATSADILRVAVITTNDRPAVEIYFEPDGAEKLRNFSRQNIGKYLAIVVDGRVLSTPTIQAEVGEVAVIQGLFTLTQVQLLAAQLSNEPLPVVLTAYGVDLLTPR